MESFTTHVNKNELLQRLRDHRAEHGRLYEQVMEIYWQREEEWLAKQIERVALRDPAYFTAKEERTRRNPIRRRRRARRRNPPRSRLDRESGRPALPIHYLSGYDEAIAMVEAHDKDTIELTPYVFQSLWENDWDWSEDFEDQLKP